MKKIIPILFLLLGTTFSYAQEDIFQASLINTPGKSNSVRVIVKPLANKNGQISSMQFALSIPESVSPRPTAQITSLINGVTYVLANEVSTLQTQEGVEYRTWTFIGEGGASTATVDYVANTEYVVADIAFVEGSLEGTSAVNLIAFPNGGTDFQSYFYMALNGTQVVNRAAQFFGTGAVNGTFETGFSSFSIPNITLPVEFKSFYAMKSGDDARLSWDVSSDEKNMHFDVLRSTDGRNFQSIQRINALQNGRSDNSYQTVDLSLSKLGSREVFYQLNQTDRDGQQVKSAIRKLSVDGLGKSVTAFPNPARTTTKLVVDAPEAGKGSIILRDALGRQMQNISAQFNKGINQFDIKLMNMAAGDYNISVMGAGLKETIKVTKVN